MTAKNSYVLSIDLGGHNLRTALVDSSGEMFHSSRIRTFLERTPGGVIDQITTICSELIDSHKAEFPVVGVGIGVPGFIIPETGSVFSSPNFPTWKNVPLRDRLSKNLGMPVMLDNDANMAGLGAYWKDNPRHVKNYILMTIGTGVGGGIIVDDRLIRGARGAGAEIGHIQVLPDGPLCGCGSHGCLEALISGTALERDSGKKAKVLYQEAVEGSKEALAIFEKMGTTLGYALSTLCYIFDPEVIAIGGRVSQAFDFFAPAARAEIQKNLPKHPAKDTIIEQSTCWDNAGILGAAKLVFDSF